LDKAGSRPLLPKGSLEPGHAYLLPWAGGPSACRRHSAATSRLTGLPLLFGRCVYYSEPRSRKASGLPDCGSRPMRRSGPCSLWEGGGPSALPGNPQRGCTPQTFGQPRPTGEATEPRGHNDLCEPGPAFDLCGGVKRQRWERENKPQPRLYKAIVGMVHKQGQVGHPGRLLPLRGPSVPERSARGSRPFVQATRGRAR
jgi:hypothetical protein